MAGPGKTSATSGSAVLEQIKKRYSCRRYLAEPVEGDKVEALKEAVHWAPSACNRQPYTFHFVTDPVLIGEIARAVPVGPASVNEWIASAPLVAAAVGRPEVFWHRMTQVIDKDYHRMDATIAMDHLSLVATELGLGTCWVGWFHRKKVGRILGIDRGEEVVILMTVGYPERVPEKRKPRKQPGELFVDR